MKYLDQAARISRMAAVLIAGIFLIAAEPGRAGIEHQGGWTKKLSAWKFHRGDLENGFQTALDDSDWETVYPPHPLSLEPRLYQKPDSNFRGVGWYRTSFAIAPSERMGNLRLEFDGVSVRADVWLNGVYLGKHLGGYTPFAFDLTDQADRDGPNLLAVKVDNRRMEVPPEGMKADIDYLIYGGIYREVRLIGRGEIFVDDLFVTTPKVSPDQASIEATAWIRNNSDAPVKASARMELISAEGAVVLKFNTGEIQLGAGGLQEIKLPGRIEKPLLWSPDHPALYQLKVTVLSPERSALDSVSTKIGLRSFKFTADQGFFLNGEPIKLIGFNRHQSYPYLGNAVPDRYQRFDAQMLKDTGANFVRLSHYPQSPAFLDACDEMGILVFEELPGWHYLGDEDWKDLAEQALREMILRDRNRPSVILWGVRINEAVEDPPFTDRLNAVAHNLDPTRPTTGARMVGNYENFFEDVISLNDYSVTGVSAIPAKPHFLSETVGVNYQVKRGGKPSRVRTFVEFHLFIMNQVFGNPRCAGEAAWVLADYNSFLFEMGVSRTLLRSFDYLWHWAVADAWRIPKDAYYVYQSELSPKPVVHIVGEWSSEALRAVMLLHNCEEVELIRNGKSLGRKGPDKKFETNSWVRGESYLMSAVLKKYGVKPAPAEMNYSLPHPPTTFPGVDYEPGELSARCLINGRVAAEHTLRTYGKPDRFVLQPDYTEIVADGSDLTRVVVSLVDEKGTVIGNSRAGFEIDATGPARILADAKPCLEAGMAAFFVQSISTESGPVNVRVSGDGAGVSETITIKMSRPGPELKF